MPVPAEPPRTPPPDQVARWAAQALHGPFRHAHADEWLELHGYDLDAHDRAKVAGVLSTMFGAAHDRIQQRSADEVHERALEALALAARMPEPDRALTPGRARRDAIAVAQRIRHGLPPLRG